MLATQITIPAPLEINCAKFTIKLFIRGPVMSFKRKIKKKVFQGKIMFLHLTLSLQQILNLYTVPVE